MNGETNALISKMIEILAALIGFGKDNHLMPTFVH
jgi:hypothetical protein